MAEYKIVCTVQTGCAAGGHILAVGRADTDYQMGISEVYSSMDSGNSFYTLVDDRKADVRRWACPCGAGTLKSAADATLRNNLDSLPLCG